MWKDNLIHLREQRNVTNKQIADGVHTSERTIARIFSKTKEDCKRGHSIELIISVIRFLGVNFADIFEDTGAFIVGGHFSEIQDKMVALIEHNKQLTEENALLKEERNALSSKVALLSVELAYHAEIIAMYKQQTKG